MKIFFVRHGQTQLNKEHRVTGHLDVPLTEEGIKEAQDTQKILPDNLSVIYSSDLLRCKQTAEILNEGLNLPIIYDKRLRERDFGSLSGVLIEHLDEELKEKDRNQTYDYKPFGGESVQDVKKRVSELISEIIRDHRNKKVIVVTHGGVIRLLHNILKGEVHEIIKNSSLHEFEFSNTSNSFYFML